MILSLWIASVCQEKGGIYSGLYLGFTKKNGLRTSSNFKCLHGLVVKIRIFVGR